MVTHIRKLALALIAALAMASLSVAQNPTEDDYYPLVEIPVPEGITLELSGMDWLDTNQERLVTCTRRGEIWLIENLYVDRPALEGQMLDVVGADGKKTKVEAKPEQIVKYKQMLFGLAEPLGVLINPGHGFKDGIYTTQRTELTRLVDEDGDDRIDLAETINADWEVSGSYHEYAFGPKIGPDGKMWITLNRPFGGGQEAEAYWRGWAISIDNKGNMTPICPGLRSPAGIGPNAEGQLFFTDNQGDHVASGKLAHIKPGVFHGQTTGLASANHEKSNFEIPFEGYPKKGMKWGEAVKANPKLQAPTLWFPYPAMGRSQTDIITDTSAGQFGPFAGQMFVGDLSNAIVMRVFLEKIGGEYQGVCFPFRKDITPPVLRMAWGKPGTLFVGGSSRGWGGGRKPWGLQRIQWSGDTPFEIHEMRAMPDGFELTFTHPADKATAGDPASYKMEIWTHNYYERYGDDMQDKHEIKVERAKVADDGRSVRLIIPNCEPYYIHHLQARGVRSAEDLPLLHAEGYYTLNKIPD